MLQNTTGQRKIYENHNNKFIGAKPTYLQETEIKVNHNNKS